MKPKIAAKPNAIKQIMVSTLTKDSQNSDSANNRVELTFSVKTSAANNKVHVHMDIEGNHSCMSKAAAVNSVPNVAVQVNQYNQVII